MRRAIRVGIALKLLAAPILLILLLMTVGGLAYLGSESTLTALDTLFYRAEMAQAAQQLQTEMLSQANAVRGYILFGSSSDLAALESSSFQLSTALERMINAATDQSIRGRLEEMRTDQERYLAAVAGVKDLVVAGRRDEAARHLESEARPILERMRLTSEDLVEGLQTEAAQRRLDTRAEAALRQRLIFAVTGGAVVAGVVLALLFARMMVRPIRLLAAAAVRIAGGDLTGQALAVTTTDEIGDVTSAFNSMAQNLRAVLRRVSQNADVVFLTSQQLSSASVSTAQAAGASAEAIAQVAAGASDQSRASTEVNAAVSQLREAIAQIAAGASQSATEVQAASVQLNQMASELDRMAANAGQTAELTGAAVQSARAGAGVVERTLAEIEQIGAAVRQSAERITRLEQLSGQIGAITEVIAEIANQTNLLALNAAIEAARAGEHGRGFAVVADEVRKLAERSGRATREIADLITGIQATTADTVSAMGQATDRIVTGNQLASEAGQALHQILAGVQQAAGAMERIAAAAGQVKLVSDRALQTFGDVAAMTEENTAATEEMAAGAGEVTQGIHRIARVSQENAASAQEVSAAIEELTASSEQVAVSAKGLAATAQELQAEVQRFTL